jgi:hypothetical protein
MANRFFPNYPSYIITSRFGQRIHPVTKVKKTHNGIDLVATKDGKTGQVDKIKAHTGGTVSAVGYDASAGNFVQIKVASDTVMVYYHLRDKSTLKVGETVKTGQIIGIMGKTGNVTGAHLHWGIKKGGTWIDPAPYLDKDYPTATATAKTEADTVAVDLPVLKRGDKNDAVEALQLLLIGKGYKMTGPDGKVYGADGSFGGATERAVEKYQADHKLTADGVVGRATWSSLIGG